MTAQSDDPSQLKESLPGDPGYGVFEGQEQTEAFDFLFDAIGNLGEEEAVVVKTVTTGKSSLTDSAKVGEVQGHWSNLVGSVTTQVEKDFLGAEQGMSPIWEMSSGHESEASELSTPKQDDSKMTREELKAHLEANEARVEQMTDRLEQKLSTIDEKIDARLGQIQEVDEKIEEREEKLFERVRSSLEEARANREESIGDLREEIGEMRGDFQSVKSIAEANFRNRRIMVGVAIAIIAVIQMLVANFF